MKKIPFLLLLIVFFFSAGCTGLFFYPDRNLIDNPVASKFSPRDVYFKSADGLTLHGWYLEAGGKALATVLVFHGNAQNLTTHVNSVLWLVPQGFNLFIFDYRGYGRSEGTPCLSGIHLDGEAALATVLTLPGVDGDRLVVLGQSLGGAVAIYTAAHSPLKKHIKALVIEGAFSSYRDIAREKLGDVFLTWPFQYPLSYLFNDDYSPVKWIKKVSPVPVLILHGTGDTIIPLHHGQSLFEEALTPKEFWRTSPPGHIQSFADAAIRNTLGTYIEGILSSRPDKPLSKTVEK